jgi:hypothetical protein
MVTVAEGVATAWPLAQRVVSGLVRPGGEPMVRRALDGMSVVPGERVVELAPGLGLTASLVMDRDPRSWTGVEQDAVAREHLAKLASRPGCAVVDAPLDATGLPDGSATVVLMDGLLSTLPVEARPGVVREAARLLPAGGRLAAIDIAPGPGADDPEARDDLEAVGIHPLAEAALRALAEAAGLVVIGSLTDILRLPATHDLMREAGPRGALKLTRGLALDGATRSAATAARHALERRATALRTALVVAEQPLILGMRRPRR